MGIHRLICYSQLHRIYVSDMWGNSMSENSIGTIDYISLDDVLNEFFSPPPIMHMTIDEALKCFDVYFDAIEGPDDYYIECGRWVEEKMNHLA